MSTLRRTVAALTIAGAFMLTGCTGGGVPLSETSAPATSEPDVEDDGEAPEPEPEATHVPADPEPGDEPDDRTVVEPLITFAGPGTDPDTIEVVGFLPDVIEEGGTCTASILDTSVSADAPAYADASSTSCGLIVLDVAPAGQTVVLEYASQLSTGTSDPVAVTP